MLSAFFPFSYVTHFTPPPYVFLYRFASSSFFSFLFSRFFFTFSILLLCPPSLTDHYISVSFPPYYCNITCILAHLRSLFFFLFLLPSLISPSTSHFFLTSPPIFFQFTAPFLSVTSFFLFLPLTIPFLCILLAFPFHLSLSPSFLVSSVFSSSLFISLLLLLRKILCDASYGSLPYLFTSA